MRRGTTIYRAYIRNRSLVGPWMTENAIVDDRKDERDGRKESRVKESFVIMMLFRNFSATKLEGSASMC